MLIKSKFLVFQLALAFLLLSTGLLNAGSENTRYFLMGGLFGGYNSYSSKFQELPGIQNCCTEFAGGHGFGFGINAGIGYEFKKKILKSTSMIDIMLDYSNLSGRFSEEAFFGNVIVGNEYFRGTSEHRIDAVLSTLSLEPGISVRPLDLPFSLRLGIKSGLLLGKSFEQQEILVSPANINFETGKRVRNQVSGDIPSASTFLFAVTAGLKYEAYHFNNFTFSPEIKFEYGLNNVIPSLDWKITTYKAGITIAYNLSKEKIEPPLPAPLPPNPEPPKSNTLNLALKVSYKNKNLKSGDTVSFNIVQKTFIKTYPIVPIVFFAENSQELITEPVNSFNNLSDAQNTAFSAIIRHLKTNPDITAKVTIGYLDNEDEDIFAKRLENITSLLRKNGIADGRINFENETFKYRKLKYTELAEESRFASFDFSSEDKLVYFAVDSAKEVNAENVDFEVHANAESESKPIMVSGAISHRGVQIFKFKEEPFVYSIKDNNANSTFYQTANMLSFTSTASDAEGNIRNDSLSIYLTPVFTSKSIVENLVEVSKDSALKQQFILGFFDFDNEEFRYINTKLVTSIHQTISEGNKIEIIPLTDNLGIESHNRNLANRRAKAVISLLNLQPGTYSIIYPDEYFFPNETLKGRIFNRSAIINIISKKP